MHGLNSLTARWSVVVHVGVVCFVRVCVHVGGGTERALLMTENKSLTDLTVVQLDY